MVSRKRVEKLREDLLKQISYTVVLLQKVENADTKRKLLRRIKGYKGTRIKLHKVERTYGKGIAKVFNPTGKGGIRSTRYEAVLGIIIFQLTRLSEIDEVLAEIEAETKNAENRAKGMAIGDQRTIARFLKQEAKEFPSVLEIIEKA